MHSKWLRFAEVGRPPRICFVTIVSRNEKLDRSPRLSLAGSFRGAGKNTHDLIESGGVRVASFRQ
jgi:hypothetical protein